RAATRLPVGAAAWVVELLAAQEARPVLAVVPHESDAVAWGEAVQCLLGEAGESDGARAVEHLAPPRLTPYHESPASVGERAQTIDVLARLARRSPRVCVVTPRGLARRLPPPEELTQRVLELRSGDEWPPERLAELLANRGYRRADLVTEIGDYAVRGGVVDLYPPGDGGPLRLDFFGDTVESLRRFDPESQRSLEECASARVLPLNLFPAERHGPARSRGRSTAGGGDPTAGLAGDLVSADRERWPQIVYPTVGLPDWLPGHQVVVFDPAGVEQELTHHLELLAEEHAALTGEGRPVPPPDALEHSGDAIRSWLDDPRLVIGSAPPGESPVDFAAATTDVFHHQLARFPRDVETARDRGERVVIVASPQHRRGVQDYLSGADLPLDHDGVLLVDGELARGFRLPAAGLALYSAAQLFMRPAAEPSPRRRRESIFLPTLRDLKVGDYVVHRDHGVGQFVELAVVGSERRGAGPVPQQLADLRAEPVVQMEALRIEYAEGQSLFVPLERIDQIQKYSGIEGMRPRLDRLGGTSWNARKSRVRQSLKRLAFDLVQLHAERRLARAPEMPGGTDLQAQFAAAFEFEETPDQLEAAAAIRADLERSMPMDRLLAGDVGFGKTEVAMRAALQAVEAGFQVAVLAPTTILADQHLTTFRQRFAGFPVSVDMLSRFRSPAEAREVKRHVEAGEIDILVGTHRMLSRDVTLPRLGLLVVDEEQRFGVAQKERFRELKRSVHVLAMSATPVPRTLQLSLAGVRDLSVIETPPRGRAAVETAVLPLSSELVREAIEHELDRGGQVYVVHNRVQDIEDISGWVRELTPQARITVGHGQMDEAELARRMHAFQEGAFDVLVATTIIENGIDIPRVNTMLILRADRFGLAQLYQLRGRVGRSTELAYCYLLVPSGRSLSPEARQRLEVIREFTELGSGFRVAARDLEIRGAGNLLGAEQSGHIAAVGLETYLKLLDEAVRELKGETVEELLPVTLDLPVEARIPPDYVAEPELRMELYHRIAESPDAPDLLAELEDRFGPPPDPVHRLIELATLKAQAERLRVQSISATRRTLSLRLRQDARVDVDRLIRLVAETEGARFTPTGVLTLENVDPPTMIATARTILTTVATPEVPDHAHA
ncbi:MAG: transcription-repair coupling factor, partial [Thermoanaerobaculia bacterium]